MLDKRTKQIWRGLVDYANADLESNTSALKNLARTLFESVPWMSRNPLGLADYAKAASLKSHRDEMRELATDLFLISGHVQSGIQRPSSFTDVPEMIAVQISPIALHKINEAKNQTRSSVTKTAKELADQFRWQAIAYQVQLRRLLTWLSDPKKNAKDRAPAFEFLSEHMKHIVFERGDPAFGPEEEQSRYYTPGGAIKDDFPHRTLFYMDIADPICDFIQREHELGRDAPIRICKRPGCGNLVAQFKKRQYCRTTTCDRERQKRENDVEERKNRDRVFIFRLRGLALAMRKKKVQDNVDRLREMASYWKEATHNSPAIVRYALEALKLVGQSPGG